MIMNCWANGKLDLQFVYSVLKIFVIRSRSLYMKITKISIRNTYLCSKINNKTVRLPALRYDEFDYVGFQKIIIKRHKICILVVTLKFLIFVMFLFEIGSHHVWRQRRLKKNF